MADNNNRFTVVPSIPNHLLEGLIGHLLLGCLDSETDGADGTYFYAETGTRDAIPVTRDLIDLVADAEGPIAAKLKQFDLESMTRGSRVDLSGLGIDHTALLAELCREAPDELPMIEVEGAYWCSQMRAGEFGGFACLITPQGVDHVDTGAWMAARKAALRAAAA